MNAEKPAEGILIHRDYGDAKHYYVSCDCGDPTHGHDVWVEADDTGVAVTLYTKVTSKFWSLNRWQKIWTLLTRGYVEYEASLIMSPNQTLNYAKTLESAITDVEEFRKQRKSKNG